MVLTVFHFTYLLIFLAAIAGMTIILIIGNKLLELVLKRINLDVVIKNLQYLFSIIGFIWFVSFVFHKKTYDILLPEIDNNQIQLVIKDYWGVKEKSYVMEYKEYSWQYHDYSTGSLKLKTVPDEKGVIYY